MCKTSTRCRNQYATSGGGNMLILDAKAGQAHTIELVTVVCCYAGSNFMGVLCVYWECVCVLCSLAKFRAQVLTRRSRDFGRGPPLRKQRERVASPV